MKIHTIIYALGLLALVSCKPATYRIEKADNPPYRPNTVFKGFEDLASPKFEHLRTKYQLDTVFHGERDELKRVLLLRHWIKSVIRIDDHGDPYPGGNTVEGILDAALKGSGFHCGHFMKVQNAVVNAYGYVTRTLGSGPGGIDGFDGHHGMNEVWLNSLHKWFLSDAKYDHHFEKDGVPLSALEIRDEFLKNRAKDVVLVKGPRRTLTNFDEDIGRYKEDFARTYAWIEWHQNNDFFMKEPNYDSPLIMYEDDYFRNNTWFWDGKPHWAYEHPDYMVRVKDRDAIYWTPNTIASKVTIDNNRAAIVLYSDTPNLKTYQLKNATGDKWQAVADSLVTELTKDEHEWVFRAVNLAGVSGPEHKIIITKK